MKATMRQIMALVASWVLLGGQALAQQPQPGLSSDKGASWQRNVTPGQQEAARRFFQEGNNKLADGLFSAAVEQYRQALAQWDNPAIHYNLALALMPLDKPLEVHQHLTQATRYGPGPLGLPKHEYSLNYIKALEEQLVHLEVVCDKEGAVVMMDAQVLFTAPGRRRLMVRPGRYSLTASREGYETTAFSQEFKANERLLITLALFTKEELAVHSRRWPEWQPWVVAGAAVAVAGGGALLHLQARDNFRTFDNRIFEECKQGCVPSPEAANLRTQGDQYQNVAVGAYAVGGAALVTGAVLLFLNQRQTSYLKPEEKPGAILVQPLVGGAGTGAMATIAF